MYIYILTQSKGCESFASEMKGEKWQNKYTRLILRMKNIKLCWHVDKITLFTGRLQLYTFVNMKRKRKKRDPKIL